MTIKTKSIFEPPSQGDGLRVLITRFYPRGVKKDHFNLWLRELSPSADLLKKYKQGKIEWHDFVFQLKHELYANIDSWKSINALSKDSKNSDITLLCYERGNEPCHRYVVKDIIEQPSSLAQFVSKEKEKEKEKKKNKKARRSNNKPIPTTNLFKHGNVGLARLLITVNATGQEGISTNKLLQQLNSTNHAQAFIRRAEKEGLIERVKGERSEHGHFPKVNNRITPKGRQLLKASVIDS